MNKTTGWALAGALLAFLVAGRIASAEPAEARQIMKKTQAAMKVSGLESISTLIIMNDRGDQRVRKFTAATKDYPKEGVKKTVMKFLEPADVKGTGFLTVEYEQSGRDNDMWLYLPALRKTRRIVSSEKTKSFMGSEFTNSDITAPPLDDYHYRLLADAEPMGGAECWKIESVPATEEVKDEYGYAKKISWVGKADFLARRTEFYDRDGELAKVLTADKVEVLDPARNLYQATDLTMENLQNGRKSRFLINQSAIQADLKDGYFTTDYLQR